MTTRRPVMSRLTSVKIRPSSSTWLCWLVLGDLNDTPDSEPLAPLLSDTDLRDISEHPAFDDDGRPGTYGSRRSDHAAIYADLTLD